MLVIAELGIGLSEDELAKSPRLEGLETINHRSAALDDLRRRFRFQRPKKVELAQWVEATFTHRYARFGE